MAVIVVSTAWLLIASLVQVYRYLPDNWFVWALACLIGAMLVVPAVGLPVALIVWRMIERGARHV